MSQRRNQERSDSRSPRSQQNRNRGHGFNRVTFDDPLRQRIAQLEEESRTRRRERRDHTDQWQPDNRRQDPDRRISMRTRTDAGALRESAANRRRGPQTARIRRVYVEVTIEDDDRSRLSVDSEEARRQYFAATEYNPPTRSLATAAFIPPNRRYCPGCRIFVPEQLRRIQCGHDVCQACVRRRTACSSCARA